MNSIKSNLSWESGGRTFVWHSLPPFDLASGGFKVGGGGGQLVWRPFFGDCAPLLKNGNQVKKLLRQIG